MTNKKYRLFFASICILVMHSFFALMVVTAEQQKQTAFDYYKSMPDTPSEEQVNMLCELFLAEASWATTSAEELGGDRKKHGEFEDIIIKSIVPNFFANEQELRHDKGDVKYRDCYEFVHPPSLKAQLLRYSYYKTVLSLISDTEENNIRRMYILMKGFMVAADYGTNRIDTHYRQKATPYYRKLYDDIVGSGVLKDYDSLGDRIKEA